MPFQLFIVSAFFAQLAVFEQKADTAKFSCWFYECTKTFPGSIRNILTVLFIELFAFWYPETQITPEIWSAVAGRCLASNRMLSDQWASSAGGNGKTGGVTEMHRRRNFWNCFFCFFFKSAALFFVIAQRVTVPNVTALDNCENKYSGWLTATYRLSHK